MTAPPAYPFPSLHAWKTEAGVVAYADEGRRVVVREWRPWASDVPSRVQKYVTVNRQTYKLCWKN